MAMITMKGEGVLKVVCDCENDIFRLIETFSHDPEYGWEGDRQLQICTRCGKNLGLYTETKDNTKFKDISRESLLDLMQHKEQNNVLTTLLREAVLTDGNHHKQWYLEQIAKSLGIDLPDHESGVVP